MAVDYPVPADFTFENDKVRVGFEGTHNTPVWIEDLVNGYVFDLTDSPMWRLFLLKTDQIGSVEFPDDFDEMTADEASASVSHDTSIEGQLLLTWEDIGALDLDIQVTVKLYPGDAKVYWTAAITNGLGGRSIWALDFPLLALKEIDGNPQTMKALLPLWQMGELLEYPFRYLNCGCAIGDEIGNAPHGPFKRSHPGSTPAQMAYFYGEDGHGLYYSSEDTGGYLKRFGYLYSPPTDYDRLYLYVRQFPATQRTPGVSWESKYPVVTQCLLGDWIDAAKEYRAWATKQSWCRRGVFAERPDEDHPNYARELVLGCLMNVEDYVDLDGAKAAIDWLTDLFGADLISTGAVSLHIRDAGGIVPNLENFLDWADDILDYAYEKGWRCFETYTSMVGWVYPPEAGDDVYGTKVMSLMKNINGTHAGAEDWAQMCPGDIDGDVKWQDKYPGDAAAYATDKTIAKGLATILPRLTDFYLDMGTGSWLCHNTAHQHDENGSQGGGNWHHLAIRSMLERIRTLFASGGRAPVMFSQESVSEMKQDLVYGYGTGLWTVRHGQPPTAIWESIPVPYARLVYSGYALYAGSSGILTVGGGWADWASQHPDKFRMNLAEVLVNLGGTYIAPNVMENPTALEWADYQTMAEWVRFVHDWIDYVRSGEWLRPPTVDCETKGIWLYDPEPLYWPDTPYDKIVERPVVAVAAYRHHSDQSVLVLACNWTTIAQPVTVTIDVAEWDLPGSRWSVTDHGEFTGDTIEFSFTAEPKRFYAFKVEEVEIETATYNYSAGEPDSELAQVRLMIGDIGENNVWILSDQQIQGIIDRSDDLWRAGASCLLFIASSNALISQAIRAGGYSEDYAVAARELRAQAAALIEQSEAPYDETAEMATTDFSFRQMLVNKALRED